MIFKKVVEFLDSLRSSKELKETEPTFWQNDEDR